MKLGNRSVPITRNYHRDVHTVIERGYVVDPETGLIIASCVEAHTWRLEAYSDAYRLAQTIDAQALADKRYQPGEMRNGGRTIYTIVDTQTGEPLPDLVHDGCRARCQHGA